jgi:hypothetical protein
VQFAATAALLRRAARRRCHRAARRGGEVTGFLTPVKMMDGAVRIWSGAGSGCFALKSNGELWGWGKNIFGAPLKPGITLDKNTYLYIKTL